jgi:hypothetical protein
MATFDNSVAVLELDERRAHLTIRRSAPEAERRLAAGGAVRAAT